jgi:hypothetical protein
LEYRAHATAHKVVIRGGVRVTCPNCRAIAMMEHARPVVSVVAAPPPPLESAAERGKKAAGRPKRCSIRGSGRRKENREKKRAPGIKLCGHRPVPVRGCASPLALPLPLPPPRPAQRSAMCKKERRPVLPQHNVCLLPGLVPSTKKRNSVQGIGHSP